MKKLSLLGNLALVIGLIILVSSCQKQQDAVTTTATTPTDAAVIKTVSGDGYSGKITSSEADEMAKTFKSKAQSGSTEYVEFNIKDLQAYLASIQTKYKSDKVYVNFAIYDATTAPDPSLSGRQTVYFSGNNLSGSNSGNPRTGFGVRVLMDYMNHGNIYP
jgi:hypothetical protein